MSSKKPVQTYRIGAVSVSIFENQSDGRTFHTVSLQRSYRDGDEWKHSTTLTLSDMPSAIRVLKLARNFIEEREAGNTP